MPRKIDDEVVVLDGINDELCDRGLNVSRRNLLVGIGS
jgi:hypothetical protein